MKNICNSLKMQYRQVEGRNVCNNGEVIIDGVRHVVRNGYVKCSPALNSRAWNVTKQISTCPLCYPWQGNLFD